MGNTSCVLDSKLDSEEFNYITVNDRKGGYIATDFCSKNGHKNIAILYKHPTNHLLIGLKGYKEALRIMV